jgi:ribonuclease P protein component
MKFSFPKHEKLKSRSIINQLFVKSSVVMHHPIRLLSLSLTEEFKNNLVGVTVSKRNFKHAVDRNRIKRQLREAYRLNQHVLKAKTSSPNAFMIMFVGKEELKSEILHQKVKESFEKWHAR